MIQTNTPLYRTLVWAALGLALFVVGSLFYQYLFSGKEDKSILYYRRGNLRLEEGNFKEALTEFNLQLQLRPEQAEGHLGKGLALMGMGDFGNALESMNDALALQPEFPAVYANRGILNDRVGKHEEALADYNKALGMDPTLAKGPGWLIRFFRSQWDRPPSIVDRAKYLERELNKPMTERVLRRPEEDAKQRSYKFDGVMKEKGN